MTNALWVLKFIWQKVNGLFLCSSDSTNFLFFPLYHVRSQVLLKAYYASGELPI